MLLLFRLFPLLLLLFRLFPLLEKEKTCLEAQSERNLNQNSIIKM
jgi:hypothetical protein